MTSSLTSNFKVPANSAFTSMERIVPGLRNSSPGNTHTVGEPSESDKNATFEPSASWEAVPTAYTFGAVD